MSLANTVLLFNASTTELSVSVNAGPTLSLTPTSGAYEWAPYPQDTPPFPTLVSGYPAPNAIGFGTPNSLTAYINQVPTPAPAFQFTIPVGTQFNSIQIYLFYFSPTQCSWVALLDGKLLSQLTSTYSI
jgi:hypothetical protein